MTEPYRNEVDTLEARKATLESELESVNERLKAKKRLPTLDDVRVASPCSVPWDKMKGDGRARFCGDCKKSVFNISNMTKADAESFLHERLGQDTCVRFYRRNDGTILTDDCPVGLTAKIRWRVHKAILAGGIVAMAAALAARYLATKTACVRDSGEYGTVQGLK